MDKILRSINIHFLWRWIITAYSVFPVACVGYACMPLTSSFVVSGWGWQLAITGHHRSKKSHAVESRLIIICCWFSQCRLQHMTKCKYKMQIQLYCQTSNMGHTLVGNKIVDHSDIFGASPVGAAPTTSSFWTQHLAAMDWANTTARGNVKHLSLGIWCIFC